MSNEITSSYIYPRNLYCCVRNFGRNCSREHRQSWRNRMNAFETFFALKLVDLVFGPRENTSELLQISTISICAAKTAVNVLRSHFGGLRTTELHGENVSFDALWAAFMFAVQDFGLSEPVLPRSRQVPARFDVCRSTSHKYASPKDYC